MTRRRYELRVTGPTTAYLKLQTHPGVLRHAKTVTLVDLLGAYAGPHVVFDFDPDGVLVGIEVVDEDEDDDVDAAAEPEIRHTRLWREGGGSATGVSLLVNPGALPATDVTMRLGLEPSEVIVVPEQELAGSGAEGGKRRSFWLLKSEAHVDAVDVGPHIDWLLARLSTCSDQLQALQRLPGVRMSVVCTCRMLLATDGPRLRPEQMRQLADLGLECSFDIAFLPEDDE